MRVLREYKATANLLRRCFSSWMCTVEESQLWSVGLCNFCELYSTVCFDLERLAHTRACVDTELALGWNNADLFLPCLEAHVVRLWNSKGISGGNSEWKKRECGDICCQAWSLFSICVADHLVYLYVQVKFFFSLAAGLVLEKWLF